jgi:hypothetical protein
MRLSVIRLTGFRQLSDTRLQGETGPSLQPASRLGRSCSAGTLARPPLHSGYSAGTLASAS